MLIESVVYNYLKDNIEDIPVSVGIPDNRADRMVVIMKIESGKDNEINEATIEIRSYGKTKLDSAEIDENVRELMEELYTLPEVMACRFGGGNDYPEEGTKSFRYRSYFNIYF